MTRTYTQDDVIRYIYRETTEEENLAIRNALLFDQELMGFYKEIKSIVSELNNIEVEPSAKSVKAIADYAQINSLQSIG